MIIFSKLKGRSNLFIDGTDDPNSAYFLSKQLYLTTYHIELKRNDSKIVHDRVLQITNII